MGLDLGDGVIVGFGVQMGLKWELGLWLELRTGIRFGFGLKLGMKLELGSGLELGAGVRFGFGIKIGIIRGEEWYIEVRLCFYSVFFQAPV